MAGKVGLEHADVDELSIVFDMGSGIPFSTCLHTSCCGPGFPSPCSALTGVCEGLLPSSPRAVSLLEQVGGICMGDGTRTLVSLSRYDNLSSAGSCRLSVQEGVMHEKATMQCCLTVPAPKAVGSKVQ